MSNLFSNGICFRGVRYIGNSEIDSIQLVPDPESENGWRVGYG